MTLNFHVDDSSKGRYYIILGRYLLTTLGLNIQNNYHVIGSYDGPFKESKAPMVDLGTYEFGYFTLSNYYISVSHAAGGGI